MLKHLGWRGHGHPNEPDPPDVVIAFRDGSHVAVEVREVFSDESGKKGSVGRGYWAECQRLVNRMRDAYYAGPHSCRLHVSAIFVQRPRVPSLRPLRPDEVASSEAFALDNALEWLRALRFTAVRAFDSTRIDADKMPPIHLTASYIPAGSEHDKLALAWRASPGPARVASVDAGDLQSYVDLKAQGIARYTRAFDARLLLLVAEGNGPGSHLDLEDGTTVDSSWL